MKRILPLLLSAALLLSTLSACAPAASQTSATPDPSVSTPEPSPSAPESITVTDAKGREVTIKLPITTYAVSTMDLVDYIVPLKGEEAFSMLVGTGNSGGKAAYDDIYYPMFPSLQEQVGIISEHNAPFDLEMILAKKPDVLIVNSAMQAHRYALDIEAQLTEAEIPIVLIDVPGSSVDTSVTDTMTLLGQIFQEEDRASDVNAFISRQFDLIRSKDLGQRTDKPTVYYEKSGDAENFGPSSSSSSGWGAIVAFAGGDNIADTVLSGHASGGSASNVLDPEYILQADPDYIVLSGTHSLGLDADKSLLENPEFTIINRQGWSNLKAVKDGHVLELMHEMSRTIFSFYPCLYLAKTFYPDEFADVNPDAVLQEFFAKYTLIDSDRGIWSLKMSVPQ